jgi:F-type H+-transporting ATPase subunit alpha
MDDVPVEDLKRFEAEMVEYLRASSEALKTIRETGELSDETANALKEDINAFKANQWRAEPAEQAAPTTAAV